MNRLEFIKITRSALLFIPLAGIFSFEDSNKDKSNSSNGKPAIFFPDKENYLVSAVCAFKTPGWGDGKNGDDSFVDAFVDIECYDRLYSAQGGFGNNTEIESNVIRDMPIGFSPLDSKKIFFDGVKNINITILGHKPNVDSGRIPNIDDKWNVRYEFIMKFKKGQILSTGYSDPAIEYHFEGGQKPINNPAVRGGKKYWPRHELLNQRTIESAN